MRTLVSGYSLTCGGEVAKASSKVLSWGCLRATAVLLFSGWLELMQNAMSVKLGSNECKRMWFSHHNCYLWATWIQQCNYRDRDWLLRSFLFYNIKNTPRWTPSLAKSFCACSYDSIQVQVWYEENSVWQSSGLPPVMEKYDILDTGSLNTCEPSGGFSVCMMRWYWNPGCFMRHRNTRLLQNTSSLCHVTFLEVEMALRGTVAFWMSWLQENFAKKLCKTLICICRLPLWL